VVGQGDVRLGLVGHAADGLGVGLQVVVELVVAQLVVGDRVESLVLIRHVDRQHAADVGDVDLDLAGAGLVGHPVQVAGRAVLAEQVHLVSQPGQRPGQRRVVDVAAGAPQQVPVKHQDPHIGKSPWQVVRARLGPQSTCCAGATPTLVLDIVAGP
jgi:hypothetical protein